MYQIDLVLDAEPPCRERDSYLNRTRRHRVRDRKAPCLRQEGSVFETGRLRV
jgi:hypothetical protein